MNSSIAQSPAEAYHEAPIPWIPPVHHLLAAIDLASEDDSIIEAANELIKGLPEISITLLTVIHEDYLVVGDFGVVPDPAAPARRKAAEEALEKLRARLPENVDVDLQLREG